MKLQEKFEKLEKHVKKHEEIIEKYRTEEIEKNKCEKCEIVAKNEVRIKAKHTEHNKIKCRKCDFTCKTKSELTTHNDTYYYSHRMSYYPHHKCDLLEPILVAFVLQKLNKSKI